MDPAPLVASIARLITELAEVRVISDRRADQLVSQAEAVGRLTLSAMQRCPSSPPYGPSRPSRRRIRAPIDPHPHRLVLCRRDGSGGACGWPAG
jgi:hypothetical protein